MIQVARRMRCGFIALYLPDSYSSLVVTVSHNKCPTVVKGKRIYLFCGTILISVTLSKEVFILKVCFFVSHLGKGKAAQDKAVSKTFSEDANTGQMTSGSQFTQCKHKNLFKFTAAPVNPNPITDYGLLCTSL